MKQILFSCSYSLMLIYIFPFFLILRNKLFSVIVHVKMLMITYKMMDGKMQLLHSFEFLFLFFLKNNFFNIIVWLIIEKFKRVLKGRHLFEHVVIIIKNKLNTLC